MRVLKLPLVFLLLLGIVGVSQAGLAHRRLRESAPAATVILSEPVAADLRKDQIPVAVIQDVVELQPAEQTQKLAQETEQIVEVVPEVVAAVIDEQPVAANTQIRAVAEEEPAAAESAEPSVTQDSSADVAAPNVRQATQPTPTGSVTTTQPNFVQQFIQNSPIGQFFNQLTGQQQQQQQQTADVAADESATPAPTIPGFLNPQAAITSAQQAVQNAAQSVVNTTTQAFQGLQQFATNLGTQFQNTLSSFGGQQNQQNTADSTTARPPGPIQSVINNFIGGNTDSQAAAPAPGQGQNPLQGIISFFQGGNRPNSAAPAADTAAKPADDAEKPTRVDDKIEESQEITEDQQNEVDSTNEVRNSQEVGGDDSFEDIKPDEVIVVNDDTSEQEQDQAV